MTLTQTIYPNRIAFRAGKQGAHSVKALAPVFEKSATELKVKVKQIYLEAKAQYI